MYKVLFFCIFRLANAYLNDGLVSISITRHHKGDTFTAQGEKCYKDICVDLSGGTGDPNVSNECECRCSQNRPVFRDDLNICVDDIQECTLLPFASSTAVKKIPYVFLPLKGQIVYPSAEIVISDGSAPVCVVSGGQFLGRSGWLSLRNNTGTEPPFRLYRDEGRTYLQWFGETPLRMAMEGRIILVHLMCKDAGYAEEPKIFTPCIAFRVAGNPNIREVAFATDVHSKEEYGKGLSVREYAAIGVCSLLLAVVYVASVFLYIHWRRRKQKENKKSDENAQLTLGEEGIIKNNPLLQATNFLAGDGQDNAGYLSDSNSCCSDIDHTSDLLCLDENDFASHQNVQTSAIVHPCDLEYAESILNQDSNNIEKLPEENVSIVETLEVKDHPETIKAMGCVNGRRKLYFNPAYFEPDLLKAPPPAALEFLVKIREVIAIAKHKMSAKKFSPSLLGIPEEDGSSTLKKQNSSKNSERTENFENKKNNENLGNFHLSPTDFFCPMDSKQKIIRKWLEDVPVMIQTEEQKFKHSSIQKESTGSLKMLNKSKLWQINETQNASQTKETKVPKPPARQEKKRPSTKAKAPPLPPQQAAKSTTSKPKLENVEKDRIELLKELASFPFTAQSKRNNTQASINRQTESADIKVTPPRPPPLPNFEQVTEELPRVQGKDKVPPAVAKNLMDAVIQELTGYKKNDRVLKVRELFEVNRKQNESESECKTEPQETENKTNGNQAIPDAIKTETTNNILENPPEKEELSQVNHTQKSKTQDDHEYEVILLSANQNHKETQKSKDLNIYNLPEILCKNERTEGYSLVSEVYVNDGYSCSTGASSPSSYSNSSTESDKVCYDVPSDEKPGRLTIHVNDSPERYKKTGGESDSFEPDTLDRKPHKSKLIKKINQNEDERYSNQKFHDMDCSINSKSSANNENFTDSLERPSIMLKTNGSFKDIRQEQEIDELFRNFTWSRMESFGSLREIYEAKSRSHRRRTETTSLVDSIHSDNDRISTLSWSEERRNKLLHRGIVLHINEQENRKHKTRGHRCRTSEEQNNSKKVPARPPKPTPSPRSRSQSPCSTFKDGTSPVSRYSPGLSRTVSPPLPPPRSVPISPPPIPPNRSTTSSPVSAECLPVRNSCTPPLHSPTHNTVFKTNSRSSFGSPCSSTCPSPVPSQPASLSSLPTSISSAPPRPPKELANGSPPLPPRNSKPPLPPKNTKPRQRSVSGKFATRPLPPLPHPRPAKDLPPSSPVFYKDPDTISTLSGASMDSLNSSDYEAFYTLPYEEEGGGSRKGSCRLPKNRKSPPKNIEPRGSLTVSDATKQFLNQRLLKDSDRKFSNDIRTVPHRPEDSGYLSTDSNDSYCPPPNLSKIIESCGSQNSETEESICDGASESGAESIATDSFFYGNFKKTTIKKTPEGSVASEVYPYSIKLSDVEVNSDTERHCVPIMVRP